MTAAKNSSADAPGCVWQARLQRLESGHYTGASGSRSARKTCPLVDDTMEPSGCAVSGAGLRMKSAADQVGHMQAALFVDCRGIIQVSPAGVVCCKDSRM
jgi:hypothetical protein